MTAHYDDTNPMPQQWFSSSGRFELKMTLDDALRASHPGRCDDDVLDLSNQPELRIQLDAIDPATLRRELKEYGAWKKTELEDHEQNLQRILWIVAGDIVESMP